MLIYQVSHIRYQPAIISGGELFMKNRKVFAVLLAFAAVFALGIAAFGATKYISIATSSSGGAFSIIGTAMSDIINKNIKGISANIEITGGSSENILRTE